MSKNIVITGASAGIGAACAKMLSEQGHKVFLGARRQAKLEELGLKNATCLELDVCDNSSVEEFFNQVADKITGKVDVLINNAGLALGTDNLSDGSIEDWQTVIDTNVTGVLRLTRKFLPQMIDASRGHLVFLSSIAAHQVYEGGSVYCATKFAVRALAKTLKLELNGKNIRVTTIDPGMVETEFSKVRFRGDETRASKVYDGMQPLSSHDIADCVAYTINCPEHVNIDEMIVMPTSQATVYKVARD